MGCKLMKEVLKICFEYDIEFFLIKHTFEKAPFHAYLLGNGLNKF